MKEKRRSILHVDLDPFFVSVERSLDPSPAGAGAGRWAERDRSGFVAAASAEAKAAGVRPGQTLAAARRAVPAAPSSGPAISTPTAA